MEEIVAHELADFGVLDAAHVPRHQEDLLDPRVVQALEQHAAADHSGGAEDDNVHVSSREARAGADDELRAARFARTHNRILQASHAPDTRRLSNGAIDGGDARRLGVEDRSFTDDVARFNSSATTHDDAV